MWLGSYNPDTQSNPTQLRVGKEILELDHSPEEILALIEKSGGAEYESPEELRGVETMLRIATSTPEGRDRVERALLGVIDGAPAIEEIPDSSVVAMFVDMARRNGSAEKIAAFYYDEGLAEEACGVAAALEVLGLEALLEEDGNEDV